MKKIKHIHFGGIGGCGISALAQIAFQAGYKISGSDVKETEYVKKLRELGVPIALGHASENVTGADLIVNSAAIEESNPEFLEAEKQNIPILKHSQFLGQLMKEKYGICVAGTHGKTTTDALIGLTLVEAGLDPTIEIGGIVPELQGNVRVGQGKYFVAEACEFDHSFLNLFPTIAVVLNIEEDHPDYYPTLDSLKKAFLDFINLTPSNGSIVARVESEIMQEVLNKRSSKASLITVGYDSKADWWAENVVLKPGKTEFKAFFRGQNRGDFSLLIPGRHNVQNALVVLAVSTILGINLEKAGTVFNRFKGVERRFQIIKRNGVEIINDYAHHPSQIKVTIEAARQQGYKRIITVFQPHTYSRTKYLFYEFIHAFTGVDRLLLTDTYIPAGRHEQVLSDFSSQALVGEISKIQNGVEYSCTIEKTAERLKEIIIKGDLVLILGAGDINRLAQKIA